MKILFVLKNYYPSQLGGPANALYWHNMYLKGQGVQTIVVTTSDGIDKSCVNFDEWIEDGNYKVKYCSNIRKMLVSALKEVVRCDVIQFSSICYPYNLLLTLIALFLKKKIIISPRGELFESAVKSRKTLFKKIWFSFYRIFQKKINFHATSVDEKMCIIKNFPKATIFIQINLMNAKYVEFSDKRGNDLIFLGRISRIKSIHKLLYALKCSRIFMSMDACLKIVGKPTSSDDKIYLEELKVIINDLSLEDKVIFLGHLEGEEKENVLAESKALVLPSESENFANVVIEAMSVSVPVIASLGSPWACLKEEKIGWWVSNDPNKLSKAIDDVYLLSESDYVSLCKSCLDFVKFKFDICGEENKWLKIYKDLK